MGNSRVTIAEPEAARRFAKTLVVAVTLLCSAADPGATLAGTYKAFVCSPADAATSSDAAVFDTNDDYRWASSGTDCTSHDTGLAMSAYRGDAWPGTYAEWTISAPAGLRFRGGFFLGYANPDPSSLFMDTYRYRLQGEAVAAHVTPMTASPSPGWYDWPSTGTVAADQLVIRADCPGPTGCIGGSQSVVWATSLGFWVEDTAPPTVQPLTGPLMEGAAQRGVQLLDVAASDVGSGIHSVEVRVNGVRIASDDSSCALAANGDALSLSPCPASVTDEFAVDTTAAPFVEGQNSLEVCARDYAQETSDPGTLAEESCTQAGVYVDNSCPVSTAPDAANVRLAFANGGGERRTISYGSRSRVVGNLSDAAGGPVGGAAVCFSSQNSIDGAPERDLAERDTNDHGKALLALPRGPSRRVKLTYWPNQEQVEMRTVRLEVRARPELEVLSDRHLSSGGVARFRVTLPGPYHADRRVSVQALAPAGWLDFPGCVGRTDGNGVFECSYRFKRQPQSLTYKFRASAPRQAGYPYRQGHTRSKTVVVSN